MDQLQSVKHKPELTSVTTFVLGYATRRPRHAEEGTIPSVLRAFRWNNAGVRPSDDSMRSVEWRFYWASELQPLQLTSCKPYRGLSQDYPKPADPSRLTSCSEQAEGAAHKVTSLFVQINKLCSLD